MVLASLLLAPLIAVLVVVQIGEMKLARGTRFRRFVHHPRDGFGVEYEYDCRNGVTANAAFFPFAAGAETSVGKCPGSGA